MINKKRQIELEKEIEELIDKTIEKWTYKSQEECMDLLKYNSDRDWISLNSQLNENKLAEKNCLNEELGFLEKDDEFFSDYGTSIKDRITKIKQRLEELRVIH